MRVICIEDSLWEDGPHRGQICAHKGSVYHVTGSIEGEQMRQMNPPINYSLGTWYSFLEIPGVHHGIRFLEIPEDNIEVSEEVKLQTLYN
jgi:hypothetical protein